MWVGVFVVLGGGGGVFVGRRVSKFSEKSEKLEERLCFPESWCLLGWVGQIFKIL
jgi:hypothetical protein